MLSMESYLTPTQEIKARYKFLLFLRITCFWNMNDKVRIITGTRTSQEQEHQMKNAFTASCEWNLYCSCTLSRIDLLTKSTRRTQFYNWYLPSK